MKPIIIVGTGLAGYMLAKEFRKLDTDTPLTMVTSHDGHFYSKPLLSTALTQNKAAEALVMNTADAMADQLAAKIMTQVSVESINRDDKTILLSSGETLAYDRLVLACGAHTIDPPLTGDAVSDIQAVNDLQAYSEFRAWLADKKQLAVIGTGLVGCEFANDLLNAGYQLDLVSPDVAPLAQLVPEPIGRVLQNVFSEKGVNWHLGRFAKTVNRVDGRYQVGLDDGSMLEADGVLSAIGLRSDVRLAKAAGLTIDRGVLVDRALQTSDPHIYALGDCAEVAGTIKRYVAPLLQCARTLAKVFAGQLAEVSYPAMPVVVKTPACSVVTIPPPEGVAGQWQLEGEGNDLQALYYDTAGKLRGFALVGQCVRDKLTFMKQLPPEFGA